MISRKSQNHNTPIVYFHSVGPINPAWQNKHLTLDLKYFEDQIKYISRNFNVISLTEYYNSSITDSNIDKSLVMTFDDGFLDNWIWAYPLLKKYNLKATIFISTDFIDKREIRRANLDDYWSGKTDYSELFKWGYLSWVEIKEMQSSGLIDFQSHTVTHTKWVVSDTITDFHNPQSNSFYTISNLYPEKKPYYIEDPGFNHLIPFGYPLFRESSAVIAKKKTINPKFITECCSLLKDYDFNNYKFKDAFKIIEQTYNEYKNSNTLVIKTESEEDFLTRVKFEISESKKIIEEKLGKKVDFICWPHGESNELAHQIAIEAGYLATTSGSTQINPSDIKTRIPRRFGISPSKNNRFLSKIKIRYVLGKKTGKAPYYQLSVLYSLLRYGKLN